MEQTLETVPEADNAVTAASLFSRRNPADEITNLLKKHCILSAEEIDAISLWLIASYQINLFRIFPKLLLISPEKRCGKTTTMEVIHSVSSNGWMVSNISSAAIYRVTDQLQPTLFIDEADTFLKNGDPGLIGIVNSGHTKAGATVVRCEGEDYQPKQYSTWMPMVLASIGNLPDTVMDRGIVINLRRKKRDEQVCRIPPDLLDSELSLRQNISTWCESNKHILEAFNDAPPNVGNDRAADNWGPLFAVATALGASWLARCEHAYRKLTKTIEPELPTQLLIDINGYFSCSGIARVTSAELIEGLCEDSDSPWHQSNSGKRLSPNQMANLLSPYGIKPNTLRFGDKTKRGYEKVQFIDAFERYLP